MSDDLFVKHWGGDQSASLVIAAASAWNGLASNPYLLWAMRRAEQTAFTYSPFRNLDGRPTVMGQVRQLDPRSHGAERMAQLAHMGLQGILPELKKLPSGSPIGVLIGVPERMGADRANTRDRQIRARIEIAVADALAAAGVEHFVHMVAKGHAAGVVAMLQAADAVLSRTVPAALVGGIDSYYDPHVIEYLLEDDRILDTDHLDGFVPGEGVAFLLITRRSIAKESGLPILATIEGAAINVEPATLDNDVGLLGLGLSRAAVALGKRLKAEKRSLDWWISDMTPESFRVQEFQLAWPRAAKDLMPPESTLEHLPHHLGDLGAATIPTSAAIVTEGFRRGDPRAQTCFITGSSESGERGVMLLSRLEDGG